MKRKANAVLAAILAVGLVVSSLSGCNSKETNSNGKGGKLTWLVPATEQKDSALIVQEASKIIEEKLGATLDMKFIDSGAYSERMKMNMASGEAYDLCFTSSWLNSFVTAVENGSLLDITDMLSEEFKASIPSYALKAAQMEGKQYAVPNIQVMTNPLAVRAQKSLLEKYNYLDKWSEIKSVEDIEPFLQIIKENEPNIYPYRTRWGVDPWIIPYYTATGGAATTNVVTPKDGDGTKFYIKQELPEYEQGLKTLRSWVQKGYIRPDAASAGDDSTDSKMGKYAVEINGWTPGVEVNDKAKGIEWVYALLHQPFMELKGPRAAMTAVGANSKNPELAVKLIELVNTDKDLYNMICYGIKDTHYTVNEAGKLVGTDKALDYSPNVDWAFGNQFNAYVREGMQDDVWEATEKMNNEAVVSPIFDFEENIEPYKSEITAIASVNNEYDMVCLFAETDEEFDKLFKEYRDKLNAAGQQKVLTEMQKQLDEFNAQK